LTNDAIEDSIIPIIVKKAMIEESRNKEPTRDYPSLTGSGYLANYFEVPS
jgi:hypothetical protein